MFFAIMQIVVSPKNGSASVFGFVWCFEITNIHKCEEIASALSPENGINWLFRAVNYLIFS